MELNEANVSPKMEKKKRERIKFSFRPRAKWQERKDRWLSFYPIFHRLKFTICSSSYFDERAQIESCLTTMIAIAGFSLQAFGLFPAWVAIIWSVLFLVPWGSFYLALPIYSGLDECEYFQYGFYLYGEKSWTFNCFVWCWRKTHHFDMPWHWKWVRTSALHRDGSWIHETKGDRKDFWQVIWKEALWHAEYPYRYVLTDGTIQDVTAEIRVEEREWRWKWLTWLPFPKSVSRTIDIKFSDEVGPERGSWKGGVMGCSYKMRDGELPEQTLRRMERERRFER